MSQSWKGKSSSLITNFRNSLSTPVKEVDNRVVIPDDSETDKSWFTFRKLWLFLGPGFLMSISYVDPGNIQSDLESGGSAGYSLLWVLLLSHVLSVFLQRLAAKISVVSGKNMAQLAHSYYPKVPRIILWFMLEIAIVGSDMQEVIGTAIALYLLSNGRIPVWGGVCITVIDTLSFLFLDKFGFRKFEAFLCSLIAVMVTSFGYEYISSAPDQVQILKGTFVPYCFNCNAGVLLIAVGIIGAFMMPHSLFLYSGVVQSRKVNRTKKSAVDEANNYLLIECSLALLCSFVINLFVVCVFAKTIRNTNEEAVYNTCTVKNIFDNDDFDFGSNNETNETEVNIFSGGVLLGCRFGAVAMYIWGVGVLASGQSSTMAMCYAGQIVMEGFLKLRMSRWQRMVFTRSITLLPAFIVSAFRSMNSLSTLNSFLNAMMMIQLPFALIPLLTFASSELVMNGYKSGIVYKLLIGFMSLLTISTNFYFLVDFVTTNYGRTAAVYSVLVVFLVLYFGFLLYLVVYCAIAMGMNCLHKLKVADKLFPINPNLDVDAPWLQIGINPVVKTGEDLFYNVVFQEENLSKEDNKL